MELSKKYIRGLLSYDFKSGASAAASNRRTNAAFGEGHTRKRKIVTKSLFPKGLMVWAGITANQKTPLVFVERNVKTNAGTYQEEVLKKVIATGIFLVVLPVGFLINIFVIMPYWFPAFGEAWVIRVSCFAVLAFNVYMNWYKMIKIGPSGRNPALPNVVKAGFSFFPIY
ncbi:unnamed protein product [Heligmosomoides polygyrus]|uniref:G_PROTEIN_RECEP_F1_2 domain-containing protein n=1 Tax=Heligmosomoides polygyrus TaxID=6339 RepID=A0A183GQP9_HELPZ|nr:unnamed protein product [Heligmosomoides polygyrus]